MMMQRSTNLITSCNTLIIGLMQNDVVMTELHAHLSENLIFLHFMVQLSRNLKSVPVCDRLSLAHSLACQSLVTSLTPYLEGDCPALRQHETLEREAAERRREAALAGRPRPLEPRWLRNKPLTMVIELIHTCAALNPLSIQHAILLSYKRLRAADKGGQADDSGGSSDAQGRDLTSGWRDIWAKRNQERDVETDDEKDSEDDSEKDRGRDSVEGMKEGAASDGMKHRPALEEKGRRHLWLLLCDVIGESENTAVVIQVCEVFRILLASVHQARLELRSEFLHIFFDGGVLDYLIDILLGAAPLLLRTRNVPANVGGGTQIERYAESYCSYLSHADVAKRLSKLETKSHVLALLRECVQVFPTRTKQRLQEKRGSQRLVSLARMIHSGAQKLQLGDKGVNFLVQTVKFLKHVHLESEKISPNLLSLLFPVLSFLRPLDLAALHHQILTDNSPFFSDTLTLREGEKDAESDGERGIEEDYSGKNEDALNWFSVQPNGLLESVCLDFFKSLAIRSANCRVTASILKEFVQQKHDVVSVLDKQYRTINNPGMRKDDVFWNLKSQVSRSMSVERSLSGRFTLRTQSYGPQSNTSQSYNPQSNVNSSSPSSSSKPSSSSSSGLLKRAKARLSSCLTGS